ncbi:MAG TPA: hypothetical protein VK934_05840 [Fimbriimonas sp.]|nr:hypothetical protein [Fimbriimonas sp.]
MNPFEFDNLATRALQTESTPNERVWRRVKPRSLWLPTWPEIGFAATCGIATLVFLSLPINVVTITGPTYVRQEGPSPFENSYLSVCRIAGWTMANR